jgi:hypothetical protein
MASPDSAHRLNALPETSCPCPCRGMSAGDKIADRPAIATAQVTAGRRGGMITA